MAFKGALMNAWYLTYLHATQKRKFDFELPDSLDNHLSFELLKKEKSTSTKSQFSFLQWLKDFFLSCPRYEFIEQEKEKTMLKYYYTLNRL